MPTAKSLVIRTLNTNARSQDLKIPMKFSNSDYMTKTREDGDESL